MNERDTSITKHIGVLDGIRAISVIIVMVFHFFQQTWIFPTVKTPRLSSFGIGAIDFTPLARTGYLMVDMMILISGFLLFLPVARNILFGEPLSKWRVYFKKRAVRILPSYLFCIIVLFIYELSMGSYGSPVNKAEAARDLIYHLLFMQNWRIDTYWFTKLNTVLWTVAVEVWFYILFPVIALIIKRTKKEKNAVFALIRAAVAAAAMIGISFVYIYGFVLRPESEFALKVNNTLQILHSGINSSLITMCINQLPAFMGTYAVGLIGALLYTAMDKMLKPNVWARFIAMILSIMLIFSILKAMAECSYLDPASAQKWQVIKRLPLSCTFMAFIIATAFSLKPYRFIFSNPLMRFLSLISYNLYIWHQWLCVKMKEVWFIPKWPAYASDTPPNQWYGDLFLSKEQQLAGKAWQSKYALYITIAAFLAAILVTFLIERPAADLLNGRKSIYNGKIKERFKAVFGNNKTEELS